MLGRRTKTNVRGAAYCVDLDNVDWLSDIRRLSDPRRKRVRGVGWREDKTSHSVVDEHYLDFLLDLEDVARVGDAEKDEDDPEYLMFLETLVEAENTSPNKTLHKDVNKKTTVGEVKKRSKLVPHTSNYIQVERRSLKVSGSSDYRKIVTKLDGINYIHEEERTNKRKSTFLSYDNIQEERSLKIINGKKSGSGKKSGNGKKYGSGKKSGDDKKSGGEIPGCREIVTVPASFDCFHEEQGLDVFVDSRSAPKNLDLFVDSRSAPKKLADEVYGLFLENFKEKGDLCVFEYGDIEQVYYDLPNDQRLAIVAGSSKQPISDSVVVASSDQPERETVCALRSNALACMRRSPHLPPKVPVSTQKQPTHTPPAPASRLITPPLDIQPPLTVRVAPIMRKKLEAILSRPYSQQEHDELWKELNSRSAVLIHRDSRSGGSHRPGQMGRSLLDYYSDLQSKIEKVKSDPNKVLNLLRMLSFYIMKVPYGNICKPWLDDSLMTIIPQSA